MIQKGKTVKSDSGRCIRVDELIKAGGQGEAYAATELSSGQRGVLKVFHDRFNNSDTRKRIRFILTQDLKTTCSTIEAPLDILDTKQFVGHYTPYVGEHSLEDLLGSPNFALSEGIQLAIALTHSFVEMHRRSIAHGDAQSENVRITKTDSVMRLHVIDLDNFNAPGMPPPPCVGHNLYMAPELREALAKGLPAVPTIASDLYSLGVLMHEIILLSHPSTGNDNTEADFHKAMCSGRWLMDPAAADRPKGNLGGYPTSVLNADLARLFRSAVSVDPAKRPSSETWEAGLFKAFQAVYCCPHCNGQFVIDVSKAACPLCGTFFQHLTLGINGGGVGFPLTSASTVVGRNELGGSQKVSRRHAVFRRVGPETWVESTGSNGTCRWNGTQWKRLPDRKWILLQPGDRLRLGDVEVQLR